MRTPDVNLRERIPSILIAEEINPDGERAERHSPTPHFRLRRYLIAEFDEVVRRHQRRVYRVLVLLVRDPDEADTLTQECFLRAYQSLSRFRGECSVQTWLLRIAINLAKDHARNRRVVSGNS